MTAYENDVLIIPKKYKKMSVYPLKGCVEYINGIIVVKMQE